MHSTETEKEHIGGQIRTDQSRLESEIKDANHLEQLISEDKRAILSLENK